MAKIVSALLASLLLAAAALGSPSAPGLLKPAPALSAQDFVTRHRMTPFERGDEVCGGDFDQDGFEDLLLGRDADLGLARNDGTGRFIASDRPRSFDLSLGTADPVAGHFDSGGELDGLCWGLSGVLRGFQGDGHLGLVEVPVAHPATVSLFPRTIAVADVDRNGLDDLFFLDSTDLVLWLNTGAWTFVNQPLPGFSGNVQDLVPADFDGDGDTDLLVAAGGFPAIATNQLFLNDGSGGFSAVDTALDDLAFSTQCVTLLDFDGDGDEDVYFGNTVFFGSGNPTHQIFRNDGSLNYVDVSAALPATCDQTNCLQAVGADLNGNTLDELVFIRSDHSIEAFEYQLASGAFQESTLQPAALNWVPQQLLAGDFDADSDIDLLVPNLGPLRLLANDGDGGLVDLEPNGGLYIGLPSANAVFDADQDGDLDVLLGNGFVDAELLAGSVDGDLVPGLAQLPRYQQGSGDLAVGDLDSDGDVDVLLSGTLRVMENTRQLTFIDAPTRLIGSTVSTLGLELADFDSDGDLDLLAGIRSVGGSTLFRNDGSGILVEDAAAIRNSTATILAISSGDLDGDGDIDAVLCSDWQTQSELLLNAGGVTLDASTGPFPYDGNSSDDAELFDADGDGDLDVYFAKRSRVIGVNTLSAPDTFFLNDGLAGFLESPSDIPPCWRTTGAVVSLDIDRDGDLDLALLESSSLDPLRNEAAEDQVRLLYNDGSGSFLDEEFVIGGSTLGGGALSAADVDGDGDDDLVVEDRVLANLFTHLHVGNTPRLGKRLEFEGHGPDNGQILLAASLGAGSLSFGAIGVLRLDPSSALVLGIGTLDAEGSLTYSVQVPPSTALLGFTSYWQALVAAPARLTNAERVTLTDL